MAAKRWPHNLGVAAVLLNASKNAETGFALRLSDNRDVFVLEGFP